MHTVFEPTQFTVPGSYSGPTRDSYDSGEEFSLDHWIEVCRLVDDEVFLNDDETPDSAEFPARDTVSEVEPAATY